MAKERAIIFDMDGTIVDNMAHHTAAWLHLFERHGLTVTQEEFFLRVSGRQGPAIVREFIGAHISDAENALFNAQKEAIYRELYAPHLKAIAGFEDLIADAQRHNVRLAVATAAPPENIAFALDGLNIRAHFDAIVGAADVTRSKPEPDVFLIAAEKCGVLPEDCIVFEDLPMGVEAARRAGMRAVALTTTLPAKAFTQFDNLLAIASDFTSFTIRSLFALPE